MHAISTGMSAGINGWKDGPQPASWDVQQGLYAERWARYTGVLFEAMASAPGMKTDPRIYANTKLLWKHDEAMVDFYAGVIYQGTVPTDGQELPGDIPNAIPWDPQTGAETADAVLLKALSELCSAWNWQQQMSLRPMYGAALGDCLTELVDDAERRFVYPQIVWPGYVKNIELDYVGNVRWYILEYQVEERNRQGEKTDSYKFTKEVDGDLFREYRDDKVVKELRNPYSFVPAVWDRHRIAAPGSVRGKSATDGTRQALYQLNSLFGHAFDFQHKAFWVPFMVAGNNGGKNADKQIDTGTPPDGATLAQMFKWIKVAESSQLLQPTFDVGKTLEMLQDIREGILAENPEASFYQQMRTMQQVTAPGAERLMGDVKNRVDLARAGYDAQTVKLFQMAVAICGMRAHDTSEVGWARRGAPALNRRRQAFLPFSLESFDAGLLDMSILPRPIVNPTEQERMETELLKVQVIGAEEGITTEWGMRKLYPDLDETEVKMRIAERNARYAFAVDEGKFGDDYTEDDEAKRVKEAA